MVIPSTFAGPPGLAQNQVHLLTVFKQGNVAVLFFLEGDRPDSYFLNSFNRVFFDNKFVQSNDEG